MTPLEQAELLIGIGVLMLCLSVLSFLSAYADERRPIVASFVLGIGAVFVGLGYRGHATWVGLGDIPHLFLRIIGSFIH